MSSPWISGLRSVAFDVPDLAKAERFYSSVWRLEVAARTSSSMLMRGVGDDHHLLELHAHPSTTAIRCLTLRATDLAALDVVVDNAREAQVRVVSDPAPIGDEQGGGWGVTLVDEDGRVVHIVADDVRREPDEASSDRPVRLAHIVLNSRDVPRTQEFFERVLGFSLIDRTRIMAFLNCNHDHHTIALADADNDALNHVAFMMPDVDSVMRGGGRMRNAGYEIEWGPGRHGPGNNAFNYFIDPFGAVIEYTAEVEQVDETYRVGGPDDWTWPPGRVDQWGISPPATARLKSAQRTVNFAPTSDAESHSEGSDR
jgi:catechol 2,3-dioxygenase-like lactoylglutathione lyase family enzyme